MNRRTFAHRLVAGLFDRVLGVAAAAAHGTSGRAAVQATLTGVARTWRAVHGAPPGPLDVHGLTEVWQAAMPSPRVMPVVRVTDDTAYAEIRIRCPLRGTGDLAACHALMGYDRALVEPSGGRLVVLASQASPGRTVCEVAIRPAHLPHDDLVPAYAAEA